MKILHVISTLNIGGAENFVVQLANEQAKHHKVTILVLQSSNTKNNYIATAHPAVTITTLGWKQKYSVRQLWQLYRVIGRLQPEVLHVHLHNPLYYVFIISMLYRKIRYIHTMHNNFAVWKKTLRILNMVRYINNRITHVCIAPSIYTDVQKHFPHLNAVMVPNGINTHIPSRTPMTVKEMWKHTPSYTHAHHKFIAIGNISKYKNFKLLANSFKELAIENQKITCLQIGKTIDTELQKELQRINPPNVLFAGPKTKAADYITQADALLITSTQEGMPIVILEALSMGVPVITTPAGGAADMVMHGENGLVAPDVSTASFKKTVLDFIALSPEQHETLRSNAKKSFMNTYHIQTISKQYTSQYA